MTGLLTSPKDSEVEICKDCYFDKCRSSNERCRVRMIKDGINLEEYDHSRNTALSLLDRRKEVSDTKKGIKDEIGRVRALRDGASSKHNIRKAEREITRLVALEKAYQIKSDWLKINNIARRSNLKPSEVKGFMK